jgi:hypothetical protein
MRNRILLAVILILPPALFAFFWLTPGAVKTSRPPETKPSPDAAVARALATAPTGATAIIASNFAVPPQAIFYSQPDKPRVAPAGKPTPLEYTNLPAEVVLANVSHAVHDYGSAFGGNPVGLNSEITSQLEGNNPKQANFINPDAGMRLNAKGELIDSWGTPYFFHQLSGTEMEIRSAGPDKIMWTADDLVAK